LNWKEYQTKCITTLKYKSNKEMVACCALEISDEITEFVEHYLASSDEILLLKELGDITYPMAVLSYHYDLNIEELVDIYHVSPGMIMNFDDDGIYIAGKIAGIVKKVIRDSDYVLDNTKDRRAKLQFYLCSLYTSILNHCRKYSINISDILSLNIEKLADRNARGVIQGDGDER
jgi:hypothetical protein